MSNHKIEQKRVKMTFFGIISHAYMFFGTGNPNLRTILKPEVELMVFLRMRSNKITKNGGKRPYDAILRPNFPSV